MPREIVVVATRRDEHVRVGLLFFPSKLGATGAPPSPRMESAAVTLAVQTHRVPLFANSQLGTIQIHSPQSSATKRRIGAACSVFASVCSDGIQTEQYFHIGLDQTHSYY